MRRLLTTLACCAAVAAQAHDTWFTPLPATARGQWVLALGTGTLYPAYEVPVAAAQIAGSGCVGDGVRETPLRDAGELSFDGLRQWLTAPPALLLRTGRPVSPAATASCWAQLVPIDIGIDNPIVDIYLDEIHAPPSVRERWAALKARGVRWQETYVKHARIEIDGEGAGSTAALPGLGMDARIETTPRPLSAGDTVRFQVLRDGLPLAGFAVQLRSDLSPVGIWRSTDAEGRVEVVLPLAGRWILRGTDVRPAADGSERWDSRFLTLAFEVKARR
jgi:hypothetical protein